MENEMGVTQELGGVQKLELDACTLLEQCPDMRQVLASVRRIAGSNSTILLTGDTGTGKELAARAIHQLSPRRRHNWVAVNCAALAPSLADSTLFGHERGAFTGAYMQYRGVFERGDGTTVLLDEISRLSLELQAKLLRVLDDGSFTRVGGIRELRSDFRLVAATNRDLLAMVREEKFLEDLYYRLNVVNIAIPSLRERPNDIMPLALYFLSRFGSGRNIGFTEESECVLRAHAWPGNVRELKHEIERAVLFANGEGNILPRHLRISGARTEDVSPSLQYRAPEPSASDAPLASHLAAIASLSDRVSFWELVEMVEKAIFEHAAVRNFSNASAMARQLKLHVRTLRTKRRKYGLIPDR